MLSPGLDAAGTFQLRQHVTPPSVYLDMCVLMDFAHDPALGGRFTRILLKKGGTVLLSWFHLLELNRIRSPQTAAEVEEFLESLDLHVAFLEPLADRVIDNENRLMATPPDRWKSAPHLDDTFLKIAHFNAKPPAVFGFRGLLKHLQTPEMDALRNQFEMVVQKPGQTLALKRQQFLDDAAYAKTVRALPAGPVIQTPTRYVVRETFNGLIRDAQKTMSPKEWIDLGHAEVSVSYADYALLDKAWVEHMRVVRARIEKAGLLSRFARVYSTGTLAEFWSAFDA
jgi:hypothetical protein